MPLCGLGTGGKGVFNHREHLTTESAEMRLRPRGSDFCLDLDSADRAGLGSLGVIRSLGAKS
jgi:hypothetical protein